MQKSSFYDGPSAPFSHPSLHGPSSSSQVVRDGRLNLAPPGPQIAHPGLRPRDPAVPHPTPRVPEVTTREEDDDGDAFPPRTLVECMSDAYNFDRNFHKRESPVSTGSVEERHPRTSVYTGQTPPVTCQKGPTAT